MNGKEKIIALLEKMQGDISDLKTGQTKLEGEITGIKTDIAIIKDDIAIIKEDIAEIKDDAEATRSMTNRLLDWAERSERFKTIEPLFPDMKRSQG